MAVMLLGLTAPAAAQQIPGLVALPASAAASNPDLATRRAALLRERAALHDKIEAMNARCGAVEEGSAAEKACDTDHAALTGALNSHIQRSNDFNTAAQVANVAAPPSHAAVLDAASIREIKSMNALAIRLGWSAAKRDALNRALNALDFGHDPNLSGDRIRRTWQDMTAQDQSPDLLREASASGGLGFPGAGTQAYNDCTVFALANTTGQTYGTEFGRYQFRKLRRRNHWIMTCG
jgi:hypothetical protein